MIGTLLESFPKHMRSEHLYFVSWHPQWVGALDMVEHNHASQVMSTKMFEIRRMIAERGNLVEHMRAACSVLTAR